MEDSDSNIIKPVESLNNVRGLTPVKRRDERKRRQDKKKQQEDEQQLNDSPNEQPGSELAENENDQNPDDVGIDYCA
jgi:hypothetical protein